ncbi:hypothetical protein [Thermoflexibacter ruber]|uniref:Dolichyl-phosphate-mannose-protein mannosyltransferase n=1 Tax=Thermoflexibacter ruber TaxID=1003 RepID=A0A1I2GH88_9BACT|nr:hypothetical protein [Thermoflexibacter ruber]SFF16965.1 hypothetical protein SAMN04488541_101887 [Thermoflexibacter ruber]
MLISILLNIILLLGVSGWIYRRQLSSPFKPFFWLSLTIKLLAGIGVAVLYQYYYKEGDVFYIFHQGVLLKQILLDNPLDFWNFPHTGRELYEYYFGEFKDLNSRVIFFSKIVALFNLLTGNNLFLTSLWFSLISFVGFWHLANVLVHLFPQTRIALFLSFFLLPSVVFWSAGLLKESLISGFICLTIGLVLEILHFENKPLQIFIKLLGSTCLLWLSWKIKYYYIAILLPIIFSYFVVYQVNKKYPLSFIKQMSLYFLCFIIGILLASLSNPNFSLGYFLVAIKDSYDTMIETTDADNMIFFIDFDGSFISLIKNIPTALFASLCEPLVWESEKNWLKILVGVENICIYALLFFAIPPSFKGERHGLLLLSCILYIFFLASFLAFTTPSIGTLVRYKVAFLPFWAYLITSQVNFNFFERIFKR